MIRFPRHVAESLAQQIFDAMREPLIQVVTDMLSEPDEDDISPADLARIERAAAKLRRKIEGMPPERGQKR